jgi:Skp family chaperone for outer membrane proteins
MKGRRVRRNRQHRHDLEQHVRKADERIAKHRGDYDAIRNKRDEELGRLGQEHAKKLAEVNADWAAKRREVWQRFDEDRDRIRAKIAAERDAKDAAVAA